MAQSKLPPDHRSINFRIDRDLYERFAEAMREEDQTVSQAVRRYMREYLAEREQAA